MSSAISWRPLPRLPADRGAAVPGVHNVPMFLAGCTTDHAGADSPRGVGPGLAAGETASHPRLATGQQQFLDKYTDPATQDGTMYKVLTGPGLSLQDFGAPGLVRPGGGRGKPSSTKCLKIAKES